MDTSGCVVMMETRGSPVGLPVSLVASEGAGGAGIDTGGGAGIDNMGGGGTAGATGAGSAGGRGSTVDGDITGGGMLMLAEP